MRKINIGRVLLGGLLAGFIVSVGETILNVAVAGQAMEAALAARNLPPVGGSAIGGFVLITPMSIWTLPGGHICVSVL